MGPINETVQSYWLTKGPTLYQNKHCDFSVSEKQYKHQKWCLLKTLFTHTLQNGESVPLEWLLYSPSTESGFLCVCVNCLEIHPLIQGHLVVVALMTGNMMQFVLSSMRATFVTEMQCLPGFLRHKPKGKLTRNWKNSLKLTLLIRKRSSDGLLQLLSFWQSVGFLSKETMKLLDPPIMGITWAPWNY